MQKPIKNPDSLPDRPIFGAPLCPLCHCEKALVFFEKFEKSYGKRDWRRYWQCEKCELVYLAKEHYWTGEFERRRYEEHNNNLEDDYYKASLLRLWEPIKDALKTSNKPREEICGLDFGCGPQPKQKTSGCGPQPKPKTSGCGPQPKQGTSGCGPQPKLKTTLPAMMELVTEDGFSIQGYDPYFAPEETLLQQHYDFILMNEVIEHVFDVKQVLEALEKMLAPGILGVQTQVLTSRIDFETWGYRQDPTHVCFYTPSTLDFIAKLYSWTEIYRKDSVILWSV